jgi:hypothetical protein
MRTSPAIIPALVILALSCSFGARAAEPDRTAAAQAAAVAQASTGVWIEAGETADRFVLAFEGEIPPFAVEVPSLPLRRCRSQDGVQLAGTTAVLVTFEAGSARAANRVAGSGRAILEARQTCSTATETAWAIGISGQRRFQILALSQPSRLVIEVSH